MGKRLYLDFNIRDRVIVKTKRGQQFDGAVYSLDSKQDNSYEIELYIYNVDKNYFVYKVKLHESEIETIEVVERYVLERGVKPKLH